MISFDLFEKMINAIKEQDEKDKKLQNLVGDGVGTYSCDITSASVNILKFIFNDADDWIEWWLWECNFGKINAKYWSIGMYEDEDGVDISDIKDFYDFLVDLNKS